MNMYFYVKKIIEADLNVRLLLIKVFSFLFFLNCSIIAMGQGTLEDYKRSAALKEKIYKSVYYSPNSFQWQDKETFWYINQTSDGKEFIVVNATKQHKRKAFDHVSLAKALASATGKEVKAGNLPFNSINFVEDGKEIEFSFNDVLWRYKLSSNKLSSKGEEEKRERPRRYWGAGFDELGNSSVTSPDGKWEAFIKDYNVYIRHKESRTESALSFDGSPGEYYSSYFAWSPDSKKVATNKVRPNKERTINFIESSPSDQLQPKLHTRNYLKPGDALPQKQPHLFLVEEKKQIPIQTGLGHQYSLSNPYWYKDSKSFTFEYNERGHQAYKILRVDGLTGEMMTIVDEKSETFIDYSGKKFRHDVGDGNEIIWASERDGWNHLYLYDGQTGKVKNQITKGDWVVRKVVHVDESKRIIIFEASGKNPDYDPYLIQYFRIGFDGKGLVELTPEDGNHKATFSEDFKYFVDNFSKVDKPSVTVLRNGSDGKILMTLEQADISALVATGWKAPEVFTAKGRDNETDIWGVIIKPSNFDPAKKYPVIEYIYAGPQGSFAPKSFHSGTGHLHELAELGFIVVQLDGMGTSNRSKAFHDVCHQNLKDAGFPDRIAWMKAAQKEHPSMDIEKVGVFGGSAGGQNSTGALLFHPDFYKVGVSSCGCHDNRMDKMWWNEQWMGYPIGPHYAASSNVVNAANLEGRLMLILGELDDNVDPASTLQLVDALIKAEKDFEFIMVPGMGHSGGGDYGDRKRRDFFVKHLLGIEPPDWNQVMKDKNTIAEK